MSVWHEIQGKSWNKCMHVRQGISILGSLYHDCVMAWRMAVVFSQQWKGNRAFSSVYHGLDGTKNSRIFTPMKKQRNILMDDDGIAWCSYCDHYPPCTYGYIFYPCMITMHVYFSLLYINEAQCKVCACTFYVCTYIIATAIHITLPFITRLSTFNEE